ncbi:MAG: SdrD B-like domain-containing protein [Saprospiraceae bacterium]
MKRVVVVSIAFLTLVTALLASIYFINQPSSSFFMVGGVSGSVFSTKNGEGVSKAVSNIDQAENFLFNPGDSSIALNVNVPFTPLDVCSKPGEFNIVLTHIGDFGDTIKKVSVVFSLPDGIDIISTVATKGGPIMIVADTVRFLGDSLKIPGDSLVISVKIQANCQVGSNTTFNIPVTVRYMLKGISNSLCDSDNPIQVNKADLSMPFSSPTSVSVFKGDTFSVLTTVANGGNGGLDSFLYCVSNTNPNAIIDSVTYKDSLGITHKMSVTTGNKPGFICFKGPAIKANKNLIVKEYWKVLDCISPAVNLQRRLQFGCVDTTDCQNKSQGNFKDTKLIYGVKIPLLVANVISNTRPACYTEDTTKTTVRIINIGNAPAVDIFVNLSTPGQIIDYKIYNASGVLISDQSIEVPFITNSCNGMSKLTSFTDTIKIRDLKPNDTLIIKYGTIYNCACNPACGLSGIYSSTLSVLGYTDPCEINHGSGPVASVGQSSASITSFTEGPGNLFNSSMGIMEFNTVDANIDWFNGSYPNAYLEEKIILECGVDAVDTTFAYRDRNDILWTPNTISYIDHGGVGSDTLVLRFNFPPPVGYIIGSGGGLTGKVMGDCSEKPIPASCSSPAFVSKITHETCLTIDPTCTATCKTHKIGKSPDFNVQLICQKPGCVDTCLNSTVFTIERTTFGYGDANNDQVRDGPINKSKVMLDRFLQGDSLKATLKGFVANSNNLPNLKYGFALLKFPFLNFSPISAQVIIKDASSSTTYTCNNVSMIVNNADSTLRVNFSSASLNLFGCGIPANFEFGNGDSISLCINFSVKDPFVGLLRSVNIGSDFYISEADYGLGPIRECANTSINISQVGITESTSKTFSNFGACDVTSGWSIFEARNFGRPDLDEFPYEVRPLGLPKKVVFTKPTEFQYVIDQIGTDIIQTIYSNRTFHSKVNGTIPGTYLSVSGNTITFLAEDYFKSVLSSDSILLDEGYSFHFYPKIQGACNSVPGPYNVSLQLSSSVDASVFCTPMLMRPLVSCPVVYSGGAKLDVISVEDNVRLCSANASVAFNVQNVTAFNAPNAYFYINSPGGALIINHVYDLSTMPKTEIFPNAFGIYPVADFAGGQIRKYELLVTANSCNLSKINFVAGWDCKIRPTTINEAICNDPSVINFTTAMAGINIDILQPSTDKLITLCDTIPYEVEVKSTDLGFLRDIFLQASIPGGQIVIPSSFEFANPAVSQGGMYVSIPPPTFIPGGFKLSLSMLDSVLNNVGLIGSKNLSKNKINIRFKAYTTCNYISGSRVVFTATGKNSCGSLLPKVVKPTSRIRIPTATPKFAASIETNKATINPCNEDTMTSIITLKLTSGVPSILDSIKYVLAPGISYVPGSYMGILNASLNPPIISIDNGVQSLVWPFNASLPSGTTINFKVRLSSNDQVSECGNLELKLFAFARSNAFCSSTMQNCSIAVIAGQSSQIIQIVKPNLAFVRFLADAKLNPSNSTETLVNTDIKIINNGSFLEIGDTVKLEIYEDRDLNGIRSAGDTLLATLKQKLLANLNPGDCLIFTDTFSVQSGLMCRIIGVLNPFTTCTCDEQPSDPLQLKFIQPFTKDTFVCSNSPLQIGPAPTTGFSYEWLSYLGSPLAALTTTMSASTTFQWSNTSGAVVIYKYILRTSLRACYSYDTVCIKLSPTLMDVYNLQACLNEEYSLPIPPFAFSNLIFTPGTHITFPNGPGTLPAVVDLITGDSTYTLTYLNQDGCPGSAVYNFIATDCGPFPAGLGDTVWFDFDKDGMQGPGEPGISGVKVNLYNGIGTLIGTTVTDVFGYYQFINLPQGNYSVEFISPAGFIPTTPNNVANDSLDSDAGVGGKTGNYFIPIGTFNPTIDAGFIPDCNLNIELLVSDCLPTDTGLVRKLQLNINWSGDPYTYDQFFKVDTMYVSFGDTTFKLVIDTLEGDTTLCRYIKLNTTMDLTAAANFFHILDCEATDTVKAVSPCIYDLALKKTIINPGPYKYRDTLKYRIVVFNQGTLPAQGIIVTDYLPSGLEFLGPENPGWGYSGGGELQHVSTGVLAPAASDTFTLLVLINPTTDLNGWLNYAEISIFKNTSNVDVSAFDIDSKPDTNPNNDGGGLVNSPADDYINGNGTSTMRDTARLTDEDDHDGALIGMFDLALIKLIDTLGTNAVGTNLNGITNGDTIKYKIIIENQGNIATDSQTISDYIPAGLSFIPGSLNPGWTGSAPLINYKNIQTLRQFDRDTICVYLKVIHVLGASISDSAWTNRAEISKGIDTAGVDQSANDADYPLNSNPNDNVGGIVDSPADNFLGGDGTATMRDIDPATDQDNEDPAFIRIFDVALNKIVAPGSSVAYQGDTIKFNIFVVNQGNQIIDSLTIRDSLAGGLAFDPSLAINAGWNFTGNIGTITVVGPFKPGEGRTICLGVKVPDITLQLPSLYTNYAEITSAFNNGMPVTDVDSYLDTNYGNSGGGNPNSDADDYLFGDGTEAPGGGVASTDQDNADPAIVAMPIFSIGNLLWIDNNNNGKVDPGEPGKANVQVILHKYDPLTMTCVNVDTVFTDVNGKYLFDSLPAGQYLIEIAKANFNLGGPLYKYASSNGSGSNLSATTGSVYEDANNPAWSNDSTDNNDNGVLAKTGMLAGSVLSDTINLGADGKPEPISGSMNGQEDPSDAIFDQSGALDANSNLTIDFGFVPLHSLGNQIFADANNDGIKGPGESGISGVKVILHYVDTTGGMSVCVTIDSILTDADGKYVFDSLIAGKYLVEIAASNFAPGGALYTYASSTGGGVTNTTSGPNEVPGMPIDADTPADSADHGVYVPLTSTMFPGSVISDTLNLGENEPTGEPGDTTALDMNSNLHMDFGFIELHSIGNQVWADANNNGILDPGEMPLAGVVLELHAVVKNINGVDSACVLVGTDTTDANGLYLFDSLLASKYIVALSASNFAPGGAFEGYVSSTGKGPDLTPGGNYETQNNMFWMNDSTNQNDNGVLMPGSPGTGVAGLIASDTIDLGNNEPLDDTMPNNDSTTSNNKSNLSIDFGIVPLLSLGDQVWIDVNNNGKIDAGEMGIANVEIILHAVVNGMCVAVDTLLTDANGYYLFDSLIAGKYLVEITAKNFLMGQPLFKYASSTGGLYDVTTKTGSIYEDPANPVDADNDVNLDDNGILNGNSNFPGSVISDTVTLSSFLEPIGEGGAGLDTLVDRSGATDNSSNLSIDFGFVPLHSIGNQIWVDANNNGIKDAGEIPLPNVWVTLHYVDTTGGMSVCVTIDSLQTDADGKYVFDSLIAGKYLVEIPAKNFAPGGALQNYISSTGGGVANTSSGPNEVPGMPIDADTPADSSDHGVYVPLTAVNFPGSVISDTLNLGEDEPTGEPNDTTALDINSNLHMDFGFMEIFSLGNKIFADRNNDGLDNNNDFPIPGVVLELHRVDSVFDDGGFTGFTCTLIGYDTTDLNGLYLFDSLLMGRYIVAISNSNFLTGGALFEAYTGSTGSGNPVMNNNNYENLDPNMNPNWAIDNIDGNDNGNLMPGMPTMGSVSGLIASDTFDLGFKASEPLAENPYNDSTVTDDHNNLTIDFGLVPLHSIGNHVWHDANNNGIFDMGELPLDSVEIVLHWVNPAGGCIVVDTLLTDMNGKYLFGYLIEGKYIVEITPRNFLPGGALAGYASSTGGPDLTKGPYENAGSPIDADSDIDEDDNGIKLKAALGTLPAGSVISDTVTITTNKEPRNEYDNTYDMTGASDSSSNLTIDFGFVLLHSIGNQVFLDLENNGVFDPGIDIAPFKPVKIVLHKVDTVNGMTVCIALDTTYTDANGLYLFDSLPQGKYLVEITADNFAPGGGLEGFFSSTGNPADIMMGPYESGTAPGADTDIDQDDNGVLNRYPGFFPGSVISDTININDNTEPTAAETGPKNDNSGALDNNSNLTVDFGFLVPCYELTCIGKVNASLDQNCQYCLSAKDVLKAKFVLPDYFYTIEIFDASGKKLPGNCIGRESLGYHLTYKITAKFPCNVNSCWGELIVEDKAPPKLDCRPDTVLCFELGQLPQGSYTVADNCSGLSSKVQIAGEQYIDYGCDSPNIQGVVKRHLIATDIWGNTADCEKLYYIKKISLSQVICPRDTSIDCSLATVSGVHFGDPKRSGAPRIGSVSLYPNNPSCKLTVSKKDDTLSICGGGFKILRTWTISDWCTGKDTICKQTIAIEDKTAPIASDITYDPKQADPHDCRTSFDLKELSYVDCSNVTQTYSYPYLDEATGAIRIANGKLPATVWVGNGRTEVTVSLTDGCNHITLRKIILNVYDNTPPTPVCKEFTQVTVDPASCWAEISAKDLDNGSHDNCIGQLHFAVALMSDIEKARADYSKRIIDSCGSTEYWANKAWYDATIERWINCYVFDDKVTLGDCGSNQVVMRVYEADSMPRLDPHLWTCGEHAWFCYNTYQEYRTVHNYYNFRGTPAAKDCKAKGPWLCKSAHASWYSSRMSEFGGSFYIGANKAPGAFPQTHLYNECMVQVLVDDKQAPVVAGLEDIVVYCDNAPAGSAYARSFCENSEVYSVWPGTILDTRGKVHGYYGGSDYITNHLGGDHAPSVGCPNGSQWAPIYCKKWLLLDSFDNPGKIDAKSYFDKLVLFDKNRPGRTLLSSEFSITDNCKLDDASLKVTDAGSINGCGEGWIQRTWMMTDKCGNPVTAVQKVIVKHRSDFEVLFPMDKEVTCESNDATDTSHTGKPTIWDDECEQVGVRYEDEISTVTDGACYKIIRTWTLIDWCIYLPTGQAGDANAHTIHPDVIVDDRLRAVTDSSSDRSCIMRNLKDNGDGYMKYIQIIKVTDHQAPVLSCRDTTINITANCDVNLYIPLQGTDNCAEKILYRVEITRPDGSKETRIDVQSISGTGFTSGVYSVKVTGRDNCGNEAECTMKITLVDKKAPTPYCLNGVATVIMPSTGSLEIWARDLDRASEDNCTPKDKLKFSFTKDVSTASRTMTCKDIIDGKEQAIELEIWVTDLSGNQDFCRTYVLLQDNGGLPGGVCKDTTIAFGNITGKLYTENQEGVEFAEVQVKGLGSAGIPAFKTKSDGGYSFGSLPMNGISSIKALRDDNPMNGVSTLDLVLIQKHILGTESLKSPYRMIAADVNNSNDISVVDLLELRKLILGIYDKLPDNTSWKFVPKSYTFSDLANPWGYPTEDQITDMKDNMVRDFIGVKIGDVNSSAVSHSLMGTEIRSTETGLIFEVEDQVFKAGEQVKVEFRSPNFAGISGFQGTLAITNDELRNTSPDPRNSYIENLKLVEGGTLSMTEKNIGRRWQQEGLVTMSWNTNQSIDIDAKSTLFTMTFRAEKAGRLSEVMRIGSQHTIAESYEGKGELGNLSIRFVKNGKEIAGTNTLYQNYPNPFDQRTVIGIHLAQSIEGKLKITDVTGRLIKSIDRDWNKGYNEVWINRNEIGATGVLYYSFESKTFNAVKKMIILE